MAPGLNLVVRFCSDLPLNAPGLEKAFGFSTDLAIFSSGVGGGIWIVGNAVVIGVFMEQDSVRKAHVCILDFGTQFLSRECTGEPTFREGTVASHACTS